MIRRPVPSLATLIPVCCCLLHAACSGAADDLPNRTAMGVAGPVAAHATPLEWRATMLTADTVQPAAADANSSMLPPHCVQRAAGGGLSFIIDGSSSGNGATGLAFGPLALLAGLTAGPASSTSTSFFFGMRLDPRAAWQAPGFTSLQLQYLAPLDYACGF
jgi:hypothetical protein